MSLCSLDELFVLAEATPFLETVNTALGGSDSSHLSILLQDVGVQIDREMNGYDPSEPAPGPETARLNAAYEPVSQFRARGVLQTTYVVLEQSGLEETAKREMQKGLAVIMRQLQAEIPAPPPAKPATKQLKP